MQPVPAGYPIERLSGPLACQFVVGYLLHWGLFGTLSVQLCASSRIKLYYLAFPKDRKITKYLVYGIYLVEFVQTILFTHDAFAKFGYGFGDIEALTRMYCNWLTIPIMSAAGACVGQGFYAYRIFILSKSRIIPIFVICVSLLNSVAAIITGVYCFQADDVTELNNRKMYIAVGLMCSNTGFRRTRILVTNLIRLTIETGYVTAVVALATLIVFFVFLHQTFYGTPAFIMPKLYANTVYMVLNSRIRIMGGRDTYTSSTDISITTTMIKDFTSQSTEGTRPTDGMQGRVVAITKEVLNNDHEMDQKNDDEMSLLA
ncbi:hypothetical protein EDD85DRAFT_1028256 [Armillaria nabsnona]|nr:hypothetical protein EDD85DRAFT_1028256 [Armillaria nabsnona]